MTLEEAKILADRGNIEAMLALASFYDQQIDDDYEAGDLAKHYYCRAAEAGDLSAIALLTRASHTVTKTMMETGAPFGLLLPQFEEAYKWANALVKHCDQHNIKGELAEEAYDFYLDSIVWLSAAYNMGDNYAEIKQITDGVSHPVAKAIYGMAVCELAEENEAEIDASFELLKNAMHPSFWDEKYAAFDTIEVLQVTVGMLLSVSYRVRYNMEAARDVLVAMLEHIKDVDLRQVVQKELAKYKKNWLGDYRYFK